MNHFDREVAVKARLAIVSGADGASMWCAAIYGYVDEDGVHVIARQGVIGVDEARRRWSEEAPRYQAYLDGLAAGRLVEHLYAEHPPGERGTGWFRGHMVGNRPGAERLFALAAELERYKAAAKLRRVPPAHLAVLQAAVEAQAAMLGVARPHPMSVFS